MSNEKKGWDHISGEEQIHIPEEGQTHDSWEDEPPMTPEEKEWLRQLMEDPEKEEQWDFFQDRNKDVPPARYFMVGEPEPSYRMMRRTIKAACFILAVVICSGILTTFLAPMPINADKNRLEMLVENIKNGFNEAKKDNEGVVPGITTSIIDEKDIHTIGRNVCPELLVPTFIPEGYSFEKLKITKTQQGIWNVKYAYTNTNETQLRIKQVIREEDIDEGFNNLTIDGKALEVGQIYYQVDNATGENIVTIWKSETENIIVSGFEEYSELEAVYKGLFAK